MRERQYIIDDLKREDTWRMFNILAEFVEGFDMMPDAYPAVTIFNNVNIGCIRRAVYANN